MVDSISSSALSSLVRAGQNASPPSAGIVALKSNQQATQAIISQLQDVANQSKASAKASSALALSAAPSSNLPRGSLVDMLV